MGIIEGGTRSSSFETYPRSATDRYTENIAAVESFAKYAYLVKVNAVLTSGTGLGAVTRALKVLSADKTAGTGNLSRALDVVTAATGGSLSVVKVGDAIEIGGVAQGTVTEIIDNSNVRVSASGTTGAGTWTYRRPAFRKIYPGATLVLATGATTVVVESKTSDFAVNTVTSGTITTGAITSYQNVDSIALWKEDGSRGDVLGIATDSFTFGSTYDANNVKPIVSITFGDFDKNKTTTLDNQTAGTVPQSVHDRFFGRFFHKDSMILNQ